MPIIPKHSGVVSWGPMQGYHVEMNRPTSYQQVLEYIPTVIGALEAKLADDINHFKTFSRGKPLHLEVSTLDHKGRQKKHKHVYLKHEPAGEYTAVNEMLSQVPSLVEKLRKSIERSAAGAVRFAFYYHIELSEEEIEKIQSEEIRRLYAEAKFQKQVTDLVASGEAKLVDAADLLETAEKVESVETDETDKD